MLLNEKLSRFAQDWQSDLSDRWQAALADVEPAAHAVAPDLISPEGEPIFPARRRHPLEGARADAHVFRAFDGLEPENVRCVLLGQDPYTKIPQATGRSFEQGDADDWASMKATPSLSGLISLLAEHRTGESGFTSRGGFRRAVASPAAAIEPPRQLFDKWQRAGVLCINAGFTLTCYARGGSPAQLKGHIPFWSPVTKEVLRHLVQRPDRRLVLLLLGRHAWNVADELDVKLASEEAGTWLESVHEVRLPHPASRLRCDNPFSEVNACFERMGEGGVDW